MNKKNDLFPNCENKAIQKSNDELLHNKTRHIYLEEELKELSRNEELIQNFTNNYQSAQIDKLLNLILNYQIKI